MKRKGALAYVALGANLGDRLATLREAVRRIDATHGLAVLRRSSVWETDPVGPPQPRYLNAVVEVDACRSPRGHLLQLLRIERELGRIRAPGERWGPRTIDLDLLWQGGLGLRGELLELPHPRLHERAFVLAPLSELAPGLELRGLTAATWLARLDDSGLARLGPLDGCAGADAVPG